MAVTPAGVDATDCGPLTSDWPQSCFKLSKNLRVRLGAPALRLCMTHSKKMSTTRPALDLLQIDLRKTGSNSLLLA